MSRIFRNCFDMIQELNRDLFINGITVRVKHYQNKELNGDDQLTKELIGVNFMIKNPDKGKEEMIKFNYPLEFEKILDYCKQEHEDRITSEKGGLNPGRSYIIRKDLWQNLVSNYDTNRFDYTYSERIASFNQIQNVVETLIEDSNSRRAMIMIFSPLDTCETMGYNTRIPCSISYQFLIRDEKLIMIYYIRSNDFYKHFAIDIYLANSLQNHIVNLLTDYYPKLSVGPLYYMSGSLHAYREDLSAQVIF